MMALTTDRLRRIVASVFLGGFVAIWVTIAVKLFRFGATAADPRLVLDAAFATTSGALSSIVGAGTAAALGIKVQQIKSPNQSLQASHFTQAATESPLIGLGVLAYLFVGVLLIIAWLVKGNASPDAVQSFAIGVIGWMGGAFVAIFGGSQ